MLLYHCTDLAEAILDEGFKGGYGRYTTPDTHRGVWRKSSGWKEASTAVSRGRLGVGN